MLKFSKNVVTYMHRSKGPVIHKMCFSNFSLENLNPQLENCNKGHCGFICLLVVLLSWKVRKVPSCSIVFLAFESGCWNAFMWMVPILAV